jgi:hypothetical protein
VHEGCSRGLFCCREEKNREQTSTGLRKFVSGLGCHCWFCGSAVP